MKIIFTITIECWFAFAYTGVCTVVPCRSVGAARSRSSRQDGALRSPPRRRQRHVFVTGVYGHVHVLGALQAVGPRVPRLVLDAGTRHQTVRPGQAECIVHSQQNRPARKTAANRRPLRSRTNTTNGGYVRST